MDQLTNNQSFFRKESTRGFVYAFVSLSILKVVEELFHTDKPWYSPGISSIFGSIIFLIALFSLNNEKYKKYAQGALLGWLIFGIVAVGLKILFTI